LEINDVDLKFGRIDGSKLNFHSVKLAAGVIKDGRIKNREGFVSALSVLRRQITARTKEKINIIVNIADNNVYFQIFDLPALESNLEEAVNLNLKMISPIDFNRAYSDWQMIGEEIIDGRAQSEIFGAFSEAQIIDEFDQCLKEANFAPVAFEFGSLALARLTVDFGASIDKTKPFLLLYIGANGLSFNIIRKSNLFFNHFISWQTINSEAREIPMDSFKKIIIDEVKKILSFYSTRWGGQIDEMILASHGLNDTIIKIASENFSFKKVEPLSLKKIGELAVSDIQPAWFSVLGSAIRGAIPRSKDNIISLAKTGTEDEFFQHRITVFVKIWRNVILTALIVVLGVFVGIDSLLMRKSITSLNNQLANLSGYRQPEKEEFERNKKEIETLNQKIDFAVKVNAERSKWSEFFEKIGDLATESSVSIKRIYFQSIEMPALINAVAASEDAAVDFKNRLIKDGFYNVDLPLTRINRTAQGVDFTITFKVKQ
jgi:Tfp pilus assembly PilM family ATPase